MLQRPSKLFWEDERDANYVFVITMSVLLTLIQHIARSCAKMERDDNALLLPNNASPRGIKYC